MPLDKMYNKSKRTDKTISLQHRTRMNTIQCNRIQHMILMDERMAGYTAKFNKSSLKHTRLKFLHN